MKKKSLYDYITDKYLTRRIIMVTVFAMMFLMVLAFVANPEMWPLINEWTASIFIAVFGFGTLMLKYYFNIKD